MGSDYIIFIVGGVAVILGWFINLVKSIASKRLDDSEESHKKNVQAIADIDKRLSKVEDSYVTQLDLRELLDILRDDINSDVNKSFRRIHDRMDEVVYCSRIHGKDVDDDGVMVKKRASDSKPKGYAG